MKLQTIKIEDGDLTLSQLAVRLKSRTDIDTRKGKPLFQVSEISKTEVADRPTTGRPKLLKKLVESEQDYFRSGGVSSELVLKELGLDVKSSKGGLTSPPKKRRRRLTTAGASHR